MVKVGDTVRFLNDVGGGIVSRLDGKIAYVVDDDGFETPVQAHQLVVVASSGDARALASVDGPMPVATPTKAEVMKPVAQAGVAKAQETVLAPYYETAEGEAITLMIAFVPNDIHRLSQSDYTVTLVNDSNYHLSFAYMVRNPETAKEEWLLRAHDDIEPGTQLDIDTLHNNEITHLSDIRLQAIAYKPDRAYDLRSPIDVRRRIDNTKLARLHCLQPNRYFDAPVLGVELLRNGVDETASRIKIDAKQLQEAMHQKRQADAPRVRQPKAPKARTNERIEVDLHATALLDTTAGLSNADILNYQIDKFRAVMDANLRNHGQKIVFIHGKGEGVLRQAITKELTHRYKGHDVQDASFREYGFGATQVTIK